MTLNKTSHLSTCSAVISLQSGDDPKTVQGNLGHHTSALTLDVYGHVSERMEYYIEGIKTL